MRPLRFIPSDAVRRPARLAVDRVRRAARRIESRPIILMYHRVAELAADPQLLAVTASHFAEQLDFLRRRFRIVPLAELGDAVRHQRVPRRTAAITIDDGYADSLITARPLLEAAAAPATVFVTSDQIGGSREFWWDELERLVLQPGRFPTAVRLTISGESIEWQLGDAALYTVGEFERDRWWHVEQDLDPSPRHRLYRSLYGRLHALPGQQQWQVLDELRQLSGAEPDGRQSHRALDESELRELASSELIDIGAHTATHPALASLPLSAQRAEVEGSKRALEYLLGRSVTSFAYPHGSYSEETVAIVSDAGFSSACTSDPQAVGARTDVLRLPRIVPRDWNANLFGRWLSHWTG